MPSDTFLLTGKGLARDIPVSRVCVCVLPSLSSPPRSWVKLIFPETSIYTAAKCFFFFTRGAEGAGTVRYLSI